MESRRKRSRGQIVKWICYALLGLLCAVLQTTPGLFQFGAAKPLWLLPLALAAALEGPALQAAYVTNGIAHARMLVQKGCRTYLPGGQVRPITEAITGPETLAALQHYNFTKAFMGANGVSPAEGFTTSDPEEVSIKTAALQRARERWFLVDNTKFDMVYSAVIGDIGCGAILTNHCPDPRYAQLTFVKECSV